MAAMQLITIQPLRIMQRQDSRPIVLLATAKLPGNQALLTTMLNISQYIVAHIKTLGPNATNVTQLPETSAPSIV
jgi:hypothetical protein